MRNGFLDRRRLAPYFEQLQIAARSLGNVHPKGSDQGVAEQSVQGGNADRGPEPVVTPSLSVLPDHSLIPPLGPQSAKQRYSSPYQKLLHPLRSQLLTRSPARERLMAASPKPKGENSAPGMPTV